MAERLGLDRSFLADVERGKRNISISESLHRGEAVHEDLSQLLSGV